MLDVNDTDLGEKRNPSMQKRENVYEVIEFKK